MPSPANQILQALQTAGEAVHVQQIAAATGLSLEQVSRSACILHRRKLATREAIGVYLISDAGVEAISRGKAVSSGPQAPLTGISVVSGTFRQRLWRAIRLEKKGTIGDFVGMVLGPEEDEAKAMQNAQHYILTLCRVKYMTKLPGKAAGTSPTSPGYGRYLLLEDTGTKAPAVRRAGGRHLYDPNTHARIPLVSEVPDEP